MTSRSRKTKRLACEMYEKSVGICPPVSRASIERIPRDLQRGNTFARGGESFDRHFSVRRKKKKNRRKNAGPPRVDDILSRKRGTPPGRYGFRHIIRDFFPVPGEIGGICRRVFGGTSERISVQALIAAVPLVITYGRD